MRKSLFAIGLLAISYSVQAQILCHVDTNANMYVSEGTLVYSGGGVQTKGSGLLEVHGNVMIEGTGADAFRTLDATGTGSKTDGGNIVLKLNTPASYTTSTYGQLYINGLSQSNITGIVSKEYRTAKHGDGNFYQQIALPFNNKVLSSLSGELNKTFTDARYSKNEILTWDNPTVVSNTLTTASATQVPYGYYMLGSNNNNLDLSTPPGGANAVYTVNGQPFSNLATANLQNAGNGVNFGVNGTATNAYNEKYYTYLYDQFEETASPWAGNYGKNIYQFGNPFLTNLDLSAIGYVETTPNGITDGNAINNIWAVQYYPGSVQYTNAGSSFTDPLIMTYDETTHIPVGDVNNLMVKPMGVFIMKLRDNTPQTLNFNTLRRFSNIARPANTDYNVNAKKAFGGTAGNTIKQLGVIGLDANGKELGRTYYVVSAHATTGHQTSTATTVQAAAGDNLLVTYEEKLTGGIDPNYSSNYSLYINEANEKDFLGKEIVLNSFDYQEPNHVQKIVSYKFEVRENAEMVPAGTHQLSSGTGFYYKSANGSVEEIKQGQTIPVSSKTYSLYYGTPDKGSLATKENNTLALSRTMVVYNPAVSNYIVRFDKNWKKADIEVYDMSGKLIISKKAVDTSKDFVIELDGSVKSSYVVKVVSDKGVVVNTKILK